MLAVIQEHAAGLLRVARRFSYCADDAQDAYQRALEIFLRRADTLEPEGMGPWLRTVVKHEALAVRASRRRILGAGEVDFDRHETDRLPTDDERIAAFDLMTRSAEALQRLKPQELRALLLKAEGHSYAEIGRITGWSYTKVNRCITEGRRSFLDRCREIESGRECERWQPVLSAIADGEASPSELRKVRPHLRHCPACRATIREFSVSTLRLPALVPLAALPTGAEPGAREVGSMLARCYEAITGGLHERATLSVGKLQAAVETAASGKVAAAAASAAVITGGGVAAVHDTIDRARHAQAHRRVAAATVTRDRGARGLAVGRTAIPSRAVRLSAPVPAAPAARPVVAPATAAAVAASELGFEQGGGDPAPGRRTGIARSASAGARSAPADRRPRPASSRPSSPTVAATGGEFGP